MEYSVQFSSFAQSCPTLCDPKNRSTPSLPVYHQLPEFIQTHVHRVSDATQPYYSAIKRNKFESVQVRQMNLEPVIQSEISQKEKNKYHINAYIWNLEKWYRWTYLQGTNRDADVEDGPVYTAGGGGGSFKRKEIYVYLWMIHFVVRGSQHNIVKQLSSN